MIFDTVEQNVVELATHCQGMRTLLRILEKFANDERARAIFDQLVRQVPFTLANVTETSQTKYLMKHQYGNWAMSYAVRYGNTHIYNKVCQEVCDNFLELALHTVKTPKSQ